MPIEIDPEFQQLLMPLPPEAKKQLEENIVLDGCRDDLVVWRLPKWTPDGWNRELVWDEPERQDWYREEGGDSWEWRSWEHDEEGEVNHDDWPCILIDGHNRYEICERLGIQYGTIEIEFASREDAADWIDRNQEGRRNATPDQLSLIRGRRYNRAKKRHGGEREASDQNDHLKTSERLAEQHGVSAPTIRRDGKFAEAVEALEIESEVIAGEIDAPKAAIIEVAKPIIEAKKAHDKWEKDAKAMPLAVPPEPPMPTPDDVKKAKAHVAHNAGENEWYTPPEYIASAKKVMKKIDCDPASSEIANRSVCASVFYTKEQDGLSKPWVGNVWMNPPYAQPLIAQFADAVASKYESGEIIAAIVLVNNATETAWFYRMASVASAVCFPKGRIRFLDPNGNPGAPLQGQAILYFGEDQREFMEEFLQYGSVYYAGRI